MIMKKKNAAALRWAAHLAAIIFLLIFSILQAETKAWAQPEGGVKKTAAASDGNDNSLQRRKMEMIQNQIVARGIEDPKVLGAFEKVDRHRFVPEHLKSMAYEDRPLPIGEGQTISQPYVVAYMTDALDLDETDRVLEIGTGSGYQAAILAELVDHVFTIEIVEVLGKRARQVLTDSGYDNVDVKIGDGFQGWPEHAPFDAVMVTCAPTDIPEPLREQLAEGGTMIIPVGPPHNQELILFEKTSGKLEKKKSIPVRFVPMVDETGRTY